MPKCQFRPDQPPPLHPEGSRYTKVYDSLLRPRGTIRPGVRYGKMLRFLTVPSVCLALVLAAIGTTALPREAFAKSKPVSWKAIEDALLRVNDAPVKDWSVYQTGKKRDPLLLKMGNRFLLVQVHDHQLFEIDPAKIEHRTDDLLWDPSDHPKQPLASSEWTAGDIGAAFQINAKIDTENRVLDLELPHPPDIGDLPERSQQPQRRR